MNGFPCYKGTSDPKAGRHRNLLGSWNLRLNETKERQQTLKIYGMNGMVDPAFVPLASVGVSEVKDTSVSPSQECLTAGGARL
jgi:hypothetical protein